MGIGINIINNIINTIIKLGYIINNIIIIN